ncbi:hypothetical protein BSKO_05558 [Bryopsis sp. KO-2023]|nr:hypothetical protein BSKO_05558 [Bryopsis sp. KO-2023]
MGVGQKDLLISAGLLAGICIALLTVFTILRRLKFSSKFYAPKRYLKGKRKRPKRLPNSWMSWMIPLFKYTEREMLEVAGTDAVMYLRISTFGLKLFLFLAIFNLATVLPTNLTGGQVADQLRENARNKTASEDDSDFAVTDLDKLSVANIPQSDSKLWVHVVAAWVTTIYTLWLLNKYHKNAVELRIQHLAGNREGAELHSVLVFDIPGCQYGSVVNRLCHVAPKFIRKRLQHTVERGLVIASQGLSKGLNQLPIGRPSADGSPRGGYEKVYEPTEVCAWRHATQKLSAGMTLEEYVTSEFREVYPDGEIVSVCMVRNQSELEPLVARYDALKRNLEDISDDWISKLRRKKTIKPNKMQVRLIPIKEGAWAREKYGAKPTKVDKLTFLVDSLKRVKGEVEKKQEEFENEFVPTAFVTFRTRHAQVVSATSLHHHDKTAWRIVAAPSPGEVVWKNLKWRNWERNSRRILLWLAFGAMVLWFLIPIAAIQALIEIDTLDETPVIKDIVGVPFVRAILTALLPGLALKIFLAILPMILAWMNKLEGLVSKSEIDFRVSKKYFIFQVLTVFFGSFIAGSLTSQLSKLKDKPGDIIDLLGTSAPQTASFFISYILVEALLTTPMGLLRLPGLAIFYLLSKLAATERSKNRLWQEQEMKYGDVVPDHTMVILLGLTFSSVNPIVTLVALLFFVVSIMVWRYQMLYVYQESYQSGGKIWKEVFQQTLVGLLIMQLMMIGLLAVKKFPYAVLVFPMPVVTVVFWRRMNSLFKEPLEVLSLRGAAELDRRDREEAVRSLRSHALDEETIAVEEKKESYVSPCFDLNEEKHEALLKEVEHLQLLLAGEDPPDLEMQGKEEDYYSADDDIFEDASSAQQAASRPATPS